MPILQITAHEVTNSTSDNPILAEHFSLDRDFDPTPVSRGADDPRPISERTVPVENEIVQLTTDKGISWIGYLDDIGEVVESPEATARRVNNRSRGADSVAADQDLDNVRIPTRIGVPDGTRGNLGGILIKAVRLFKPRNTTYSIGEVVEPIARKLLFSHISLHPKLYRHSNTNFNLQFRKS